MTIPARLITLVGLAIGSLFAAGSAAGAIRTPVTVGASEIGPGIGVSYGAYNFTVEFSGPDDPAAGFVKGPKVGHCIEETVRAVAGSGSLLTGVEGANLSLANDDPANLAIAPGGRDRLEWLLLSSHRSRLTTTGATRDFEAAAHQKAIWLLTNPTTEDLTDPTGSNPTLPARAQQLLADSARYASGVGRTPALAPVGADVCAGATRTLRVTGAPLTTVLLAFVTGTGTFTSGAVAAGGGQTTVVLGPDGIADVTLTSPGPGTVTVRGTFEQPTLVQVERPNTAGGGQDFAYVEFRTVSVDAAIRFVDCTTPPPPPPPTVTVTGAGSAVLALSKVGVRRARSGELVRYLIRVRNTGTIDATDVIVRDVLPSGYALVRSSPRATLVKGRPVWQLGTLAANATRTIQVDVRVDRNVSGRRCNTATVEAGNAASRTSRACTDIVRVRGIVRVPIVTG